jgi:hypothetical protein
MLLIPLKIYFYHLIFKVWLFNKIMDKKVYEKIVSKKEFSKLPKKDVEKIWDLFARRETSEEDKVKLTRDLLRKVYFAFGSLKLLNKKLIDKKPVEEIMKKHISTKERFDFYLELYKILFSDYKLGETLNIIDLGAGINGLSFKYMQEAKKDINYIGIEAVGQLVELMNHYFKNRGVENAHALQESLFELEKVKKLIKQIKGKKIVFLFKTLDSLEMIERNYSKELLREIVPLVDRVVVSFATKSLISKKKFKVKRYWFENFVKENFQILGDFELGGERYLFFGRDIL